MSRALFPGPYNDYSGVTREVLGDEYQNVVALLKLIPELRDMVKSLHTDAKDKFNTDLVSALEDIKTGLSLAQDKFKETVDCANKEIEDKASNSSTALSKALKDQADYLRSQMSGWGSTLIDSIKAHEQPVVDQATAAIQAARDVRVTELATALQDTANQRITDVQNAAATTLTQIKAAQSNIQVLQYDTTTDDLTQAPKPSDITAPAILFFTLNQGKPANVFRAYIWNTVSQSWGTKALEMDQPADGAQGPKGDNGTIIIPAVWTPGSTIPAVTRADGSVVVQGDLLLNGTDGSLYQNTSSTPGQPNWNPTGSLRGPTGTAPDLSMVIKTTSDSTDDPVDLIGINTVMGKPWVRDKNGSTYTFLATQSDITALQTMLANSIAGVPIGVPIPWPSTVIPSNALAMQGQSFAANNNPQLAAMYPGLIIPDMRGLVMRGYDPTGIHDPHGPTRGLLSFQNGTYMKGPENEGSYPVTFGTYTFPGGDEGLDYAATNATTGAVHNAQASNGWSGLSPFNTGTSQLGLYGATRMKNMAWNYIVRVV